MRRMKTKEAQEKAKKLAAIIEARKELEKEEKMIKKFFKNEMKADRVVVVGNWLIILEDRQRTGLDREALERELGDEIRKFEKITEYVTLTIKGVL